MPLAPGAKLGPCEILGPLDAGGMGGVSRARDTRLDPEVAVKILPAGFAKDHGRLRKRLPQPDQRRLIPNILAPSTRLRHSHGAQRAQLHLSKRRVQNKQPRRNDPHVAGIQEPASSALSNSVKLAGDHSLIGNC